ncbi:MAG TPA: SDR family NAD(P)-dependent oxidoreductase [Ktedonobacterales bacterium]|nr:SDR family NAD(P)-dependent oxidoreductase [Ktedonobacterales bacterium]
MAERRFDGRVAVVTGAGRGLGREYAMLLASKGARVVVNDNGSALDGSGNDAGLAEAVVGDIRQAGGEASACTESVATEAGGKAIVQHALDRFGRLDALIHNAGNVRRDAASQLSVADFRAVVDVHLMGAFHLTRAAFPVMAEAKFGRVVYVSSIAGLYGAEELICYGAAKTSLIGVNNVVAIEGARHNIKCNIMAPGAVTRMADGIDMSRMPAMGADLVAPAVGWLAHESCTVSGEMFAALAGRVARMMLAETEGVYRAHWSIDDIAENIDAIRNTDKLWILPTLSGHDEHIRRSIEMTRAAD